MAIYKSPNRSTAVATFAITFVPEFCAVVSAGCTFLRHSMGNRLLRYLVWLACLGSAWFRHADRRGKASLEPLRHLAQKRSARRRKRRQFSNFA
jgi:hypothetical protein